MEVLRRRFYNGDPALPLRHSAQIALKQCENATDGAGWIDDVLIVISELVQNVNQHTRSDGELILSTPAGLVLVEVGDADTTVPLSRRSAHVDAGGRGLLLIEALASRWGTRTCESGKVVWAEVAMSVP